MNKDKFNRALEPTTSGLMYKSSTDWADDTTTRCDCGTSPPIYATPSTMPSPWGAVRPWRPKREDCEMRPILAKHLKRWTWKKKETNWAILPDSGSSLFCQYLCLGMVPRVPVRSHSGNTTTLWNNPARPHPCLHYTELIKDWTLNPLTSHLKLCNFVVHLQFCNIICIMFKGFEALS